MTKDTIDLEQLTGKRLGPYKSFNPVSRVQIWQWCRAMGDHNPLYLDEAYQESKGIEGAIAPPAMMQMWTMRDVTMTYAPGSTDAAPYQVFDDLKAAGFPANVAVSYDIQFHRYLSEGEQAHHYTTVVSITPLKKTALGAGHFVTERVEYLTEDEELFAEALITYFQYQPTAQTEKTQAFEPPQPPAGKWQPDFKDLDTRSLEPGQTLPELAIPITHKLIVSGAVASQDFIDVHHNAPQAVAAAMPDIFMNILTTCGLAGRYLSDWAGPRARLERLSFKLLAPNTPGDTMVMQGSVSSVDAQHVGVDFAGRNGRGFHLTGKAVLQLGNS
ncbi:FAS1-like dehydratase domain-containing protein [Halioglobus maricola]|nr:MaoC family dehydratase N-terminal domain-containing protein [Halioglobus maricola]